MGFLSEKYERFRPWRLRTSVLGHGFETARCAGYAAILTPVAASGSRPFCSALI